MRSLPPCLLPALLGLSLLGAAPLAVAQDDVGAKWQALVDRNNELAARADALEAEYDAADPARKQAIEAEFRAVAERFNSEILPGMQAIAGKAFEADPTNVKAGEFAVRNAYQRNQYERTERLAEALLKADPKSTDGLNIRGLSQFAQNKFIEAQSSFRAAAEAGVASDDVKAFSRSLPAYIGYWEEEQKTRQAQADMNLPRVKFATNKGDIVLELFEEEAPNTVANMISLAESGFYDGVKFHRVIPNFMAQGGDPLSKDADPSNDGTGGPGYAIPSEFDAPNARKHFRGTLSMANSGPNTGGSQFFVTVLPTTHLNGRHTVYGRVIEGMDVVDGLQIGDVIEKATVLNKRPGSTYTVKKLAER